MSGTSHFAWSLDRRYAYFHQSLLEAETPLHPVRASELTLIELDTKSFGERIWRILPPSTDNSLDTANFHSAFYYEDGLDRYVGLLRTGARLQRLSAHPTASEHPILPMPSSTIWILRLDNSSAVLRATLLPGLDSIDALALSHLTVTDTRDGFTLYANYKNADISEETHGPNTYGEEPDEVTELYSGMVVEAINHGTVIRYELRNGAHTLRTFSRPYDPANTSRGHSWLPINVATDPSGERLFCTFSGFRPRLLPRHIASGYPRTRVVDPTRIRSVPSLLLRLNAKTLQPDWDVRRSHLSYAEPMAMTVVGDAQRSYVCTFSGELGVRIYPSEDLTSMVCRAVAPQLMNCGQTHFRPDPAHIEFVGR